MNEKTLILLRGLPGSGKSELARLLALTSGFFVCSIDDYFMDESGNYVFDYKRNHLAYEACQKKTESAMQNSSLRILLDHTFKLDWEMSPYYELAKKYGYKVHTCTLENRHNGENIHGISDDQLRKMAKGFKVELLPNRLEDETKLM